MKPSAKLIDQFAERLAEHGEVARAAKECSVRPAYGRVLLQRIIKRLGVEQCR
jgi:hypothetical protein